MEPLRKVIRPSSRECSGATMCSVSTDRDRGQCSTSSASSCAPTGRSCCRRSLTGSRAGPMRTPIASSSSAVALVATWRRARLATSIVLQRWSSIPGSMTSAQASTSGCPTNWSGNWKTILPRQTSPSRSCSATSGIGAYSCRALRTGYGQNRHDLHGLAREDHEVRMVFEQLRGGFVRIRAHDGVGAHLVADIRDAARRDLLGLAERSTHADDRTVVLFDPCLPGGHSLAFICPPLLFWKGCPCPHFRAGFAAKENSEIGIRAHDLPFPSRFAALMGR